MNEDKKKFDISKKLCYNIYREREKITFLLTKDEIKEYREMMKLNKVDISEFLSEHADEIELFGNGLTFSEDAQLGLEVVLYVSPILENEITPKDIADSVVAVEMKSWEMLRLIWHLKGPGYFTDEVVIYAAEPDGVCKALGHMIMTKEILTNYHINIEWCE